jgi:hypothetical protein
MKDGNGKEIDISSLAIAIDFKKKTKPKPNTDRTHNLISQPSLISQQSLAKKETADLNSNNSSLLEKKKQYSMAIREKNLNTNTNTKKSKN